MFENDVAGFIVEEAIHVHKSIGPGMLESAYLHSLHYRLQQRGLVVRKEVPIPLVFESVRLDCGYRADLVVQEKIVIEIKNVDLIAPIHVAQTITYLRLLNLKLGFILNFNTLLMRDGIKRVANHL